MANEDTEKIPDIVDEIRHQARVFHDAGKTYAEYTLTDYADRIEAAWKREREPVGKSDMLGNAAKMRKALEMIAKVSVPPIRIHVSSPGYGVIIHEPEPESEWLAMLRKCVKRANAALSAPVRNCDVYKSADEAWAAYRVWECGLDYAHGAIGMDFRTWAFSRFAPAEKEGAK